MENTASTTGRLVRVVTVRVPRIFYEDHLDRGLLSGKPVKWMKNQVEVVLDWHELMELQEDAFYYSEPLGWGFLEDRSLQQSAQRTVATLSKLSRQDFLEISELVYR